MVNPIRWPPLFLLENERLLKNPLSTAMSPFVNRAFSLVELLVVVSAISVMMVLAVPAIKTAGRDSVTSSAPVISGIFNSAREYAIARNTYTWLCFGNTETDARAVIVASRSGINTLGWPVQSGPLDSHADLEIVGRVETFTGIHIADQPNVEIPDLPPDTVTPLAAADLTVNKGGVNVTFSRVIQFSPSGAANCGPVTVRRMEIVLVSALRADDPAQAVFRINGLTGKSNIYRL